MNKNSNLKKEEEWKKLSVGDKANEIQNHAYITIQYRKGILKIKCNH